MPGDARWRPRKVRHRRLGRGRGDGPRSLALPAAAAPALALALTVGCGTDDGRTLDPPSADQTTTTTTVPASTATTAGVDAGSASGVTASSAPLEPLRLTSPTIAEAGDIPDDYTCWGRDRSPPLEWGPVPPGTVELALVVRDIDAGGFVHWVIAGLGPTAGGVAEAAPPGGAVEALNDFGRPGWSGPCPPEGTHNYEFRVYALAEPSGVTEGMPGPDAATRVEGTAARTSAVLSATASPT
ncbi:MAG: YbhB/YbcL family Raf kinase inhibitor-like protein [Acidimicrobiales bacterium]